MNRLIWSTRGESWVFRFLLDGGYSDPLPVFETAFQNHWDEREFFRKDSRGIALRFPDPHGRRDRAGRVIPHEFVIEGPDADEIGTFDQAKDYVWNQVGDDYALIWDQADPDFV